MDDLIRRSDAIMAMAKAIGHIVYDAEAVSQHVMNSIPAVEPKQGEWINEMWTEDALLIGVECSNCHIVEGRFYTYCPNCGARMKGADDEDSNMGYSDM